MGKPTKASLTAKAETLGIEVDPEWTARQIQAAIKEAKEAPVEEPAAETPFETPDEDSPITGEDPEGRPVHPAAEWKDEVGSHDPWLVKSRPRRHPGVLRLPHIGHVRL